MLSKYGNCTHLPKIKNKLKIVVFTRRILDILSAFLDNDYSQLSASLRASFATISYPTCTHGINVKYLFNDKEY